jgi:dihydrofolate reductase
MILEARACPEVGDMGKLVFGMMQSLDGYVAGAAGEQSLEDFVAGVAGGTELPPPGVALHHHFNVHVGGLAGILYGRRMYEVMRYWDEDRPDWDAGDHEFAAAWRAQPKWVVSRSLKSVGPNAALVGDDVEAFVRRLKAEVEGEIDVAGPELAGSLTAVGLIDEYRLYFRPFVLGGGKPYFAGARPPLRLVATNHVGEDAIELRYVPT